MQARLKKKDMSEKPVALVPDPEQWIGDKFRRWGYLQAAVDPFGQLEPFPHRELDEVPAELAEEWRDVYCGKIGAEFMHMPYPDRCDWVADRMEGPAPRFDRAWVLKRIVEAEMFERFLHTRYVGAKRFSIEGLSAVIPCLDVVLSQLAEHGVHTAVLGMAHRGRLTSMLSIAGAAAHKIFACFEDVDPRAALGSGDVKYHKGATGFYVTPTGKRIKIHLASNPSHLEAVNPVIMGRVRAKQERIGQGGERNVVAILIHGDAAFAGQGINAECLNFAGLPGWDIGGTVHIIANNLIGFTATPDSLHATRFASEVAKRIPIPIFHVNGDSPEHVVRTSLMAADYRNEFLSDVVIDVIGYRRFGHNEGDDPTTMAPLLYDKIKDHPRLHELYAREQGIAESDIQRLEQDAIEVLKVEIEKAREMTSQPVFAKLPDYWDHFVGGPYKPLYEAETKISAKVIEEITDRITSVPEGFNVHPKVAKNLEQRKEMGYGNRPLDYGMAEALAFGSLLVEGHPVRVVGQDSRRGTFNHRQAAMIDIKNGKDYIPLQHLKAGQGRFQVYDSMLSEAAVLGYEYGYSRDLPEALSCWEAQFGDFVNGAQIITDQFICAAEDKWGLLSSIVLLLPHGFEGQGPEHSSARVERFLQLCAEDNMQVCQPSTAGQYFHLLRRQVKRPWRKPLVVFTPKSMLRAAVAASPRTVLETSSFQNVLADSQEVPDADRILLASGKIVHELRTERTRLGDTRTAVISLEQLYPFPEKELAETLSRYKKARQLIWVQEEPANMGALFFVRPLLDRVAPDLAISTVKRSESASPATGSPKAHAMEQQALLNLAFARYQ